MAPPLHWWCLVQVKKNLFVWINTVRIMYRVFPFEQTAQWWSFVWSCLTLKFPWQERKHNSDIFVCFRNFVQRKVGWNLIEVMFFRRRWELFFHQGVRLYLITLESASLTVTATWGGGGWMKTLYTFSPFTLMSASWTVTTAWRGGWMKAPCWLLSPPQLLRENGCLPKTDCSRYIL